MISKDWEIPRIQIEVPANQIINHKKNNQQEHKEEQISSTNKNQKDIWTTSYQEITQGWPPERCGKGTSRQIS